MTHATDGNTQIIEAISGDIALLDSQPITGRRGADRAGRTRNGSLLA